MPTSDVGVLDLATNPDFASSEFEKVVERLKEVGALAVPPMAEHHAFSRERLAAARKAAGSATPLSRIVGEGR